MAIHLVVSQPFGDYAKGDRITDPAAVQKLLLEHPHRVVKINAEDAPQPQQTV